MPPCPGCEGDRPPGRAYCSPCNIRKVREWEAANPERARETKRRARAKYNAKIRAQLRLAS